MKTALAFALLPSLANAGCPWSTPPPAEYDYVPTVPVYEYPVKRAEIVPACNALFGKPFEYWIDGCGARVVMPDGTVYGVVIYLEGCLNIRRHEYGHVNSWVHP